MYNLFTKKVESNNSVIRPANFELIRRIYQRELATIAQYYNSRVYTVKSNHILCRLLNTGYVPIEYSLERFLEAAYARAPYLAKYFNFTSELGYGKVFDGDFYGPGNDEIIIYNEDYFNPFEAAGNWKALQPLKVLEHPVSDFSLLLPNGNDHNSAKGLVVITINVPMLLVMYRGFLLSRSGRDSEQQLGISHFVHMYVLPSMMESHTDIVVLNRLKNLFYAAPMSQSTKHHPFPIVDYSDKVDRVNTDVLKHLKDTSRLYSQYLKCIPSMVNEDMQESLLMPDLAKTRQVWWALIMARLSTMKFLIDLGGEHGQDANGTYIHKLQIDIRQLRRESVLDSVLPIDIAYDVEQVFNDISALQ